jgi:hypothetical protein
MMCRSTRHEERTLAQSSGRAPQGEYVLRNRTASCGIAIGIGDRLGRAAMLQAGSRRSEGSLPRVGELAASNTVEECLPLGLGEEQDRTSLVL